MSLHTIKRYDEIDDVYRKSISGINDSTKKFQVVSQGIMKNMLKNTVQLLHERENIFSFFFFKLYF